MRRVKAGDRQVTVYGTAYLDSADRAAGRRHGALIPCRWCWSTGTCWFRIVDFAALAGMGLIEAGDLDLFDIVDDAEIAWTTMARRGLLAHTPLDDAPAGTSVP